MDVLAIILACSLHPDDALIRTLVDVQSEGNVYFVGDLVTLKSKDWLASAEAALSYAEDIERHGGRPAVGLLGIPLAWASRYGRAPIELFDGCTNIAVATAAFAEYQDRCSPGRPQHARRPLGARPRHARRPIATPALRMCELSLFARDLGVVGAPAAILRRVGAERDASSVTDAGAPPQRSSVFVDGSEAAGPVSARRTGPTIFLRSFPDVPATR